MTRRIRTAFRKWTGDKELVTAAALILLGVMLRLLFLEELPYGLNQDEASAGYDAWALLRSGMDRNGKSWPVLFVSWGSGQNVLMSYLAMPWIAVLGLRPLSIRLPNALAGCATIFVFWRLARRCRGERFGLCALFLLVINPWHIMASRWGLESNLLPALLLGACFSLSRAKEKPGSLIGAAVCLGLAPYAYGTVFFFLPPFLIASAFHLKKSLRWKPTCGALMIFALLIFPIALCQALNLLGGEELRILGVTLPRLIDTRQNATSVFGGGLGMIRKNIMVFLEILHNGDDGVQYNALPFWQGGLFYFFGLPLSLLGTLISVLERDEQKDEWPLRAMLFSAVFCAALIDGNINRLNMIWLPMIYYSALGGVWLTRHLRIKRLIPLAAATVCFFFFSYCYVRAFGSPGNAMYFPGLGEAIETAEKMNPKKLYISSRSIRQPYIYALFYTKPEPERFMGTVEYGVAEDGVMQTVERFEGFEFGETEAADLLILTNAEAAEQGKTVLTRHGAFTVCR